MEGDERDGNWWGWLAGAFVVALLVLYIFGGKASGQIPDVQPEIGRAVFCDTPDQIERVFQGGPSEAEVAATVAAINKGLAEPACGVLTAVFLRVPGEVRRVTASEGEAYAIIEVLVVGIANEDAGVQMVQPTRQFVGAPVEDEPETKDARRV